MLVDKRTRSLVIRSEQPELIRKAIPTESRIIEFRGERMVQVKHTLKNARILQNAGHDAPSPIRYYYDFPKPPWIKKIFEHQIDTAECCTMHRRLHVLNEMGTMKTSSVLFAADYLMNLKRVGKALIAAPLSTLDKVWANEIFNFLMHRQYVVLHHSKLERRRAMLDADVDFYIINYDGLGLLEDELRERPDINLYIIDEAAKYRNSKSERFKTLDRLANIDQHPKLWYWHLTGTPTPKAPVDAWAQARLVNPARVPRYYSHFRNQTMYQKSKFKWVPRPGAHKIVFDALQPAIRIRKKDCITLPPVTSLDREAPLTKEQKRLLKELKNEMVAELNSGVQIVAQTAADRMMKFRQILLGAVKDPKTKDTYYEIDHQPRFDVLLELIEEASAKVIVVVPYKGIIRVLEKELSQHYSCAIVNGDVSKPQRDKIFTAFKMDEDPHTLLCHPEVMAHGLTLTEADTLIFYGPIGAELSQQVTERINRAGQTRPMTIGRIGCHPVEWDYYKTVETQGAEQLKMLDLYRREMRREGI